ncbi:putative Peroxidase 48 [Humulus lupulus]|uniref:putative Peroxidase 48 n=1 Tax=Humulus lupulus TaxID=3486 RepID=UPI002B411366|nr:putative Peroxidase 48 [Humulus lupulus]
MKMMEMKMMEMNVYIRMILSIGFLSLLLTFTITNPRGRHEQDNFSFLTSTLSSSSVSMASLQDSLSGNGKSKDLEYDFYRDSCPDAQQIVRSKMVEAYSHHKDISAALLRLFFHDCFVHGCDASVLLDDSHGNRRYSTEKQAVPNKSLRGFDTIDMIKEEIERVCPGIVSCADIISLATRDGIILAGGPFYPVFTGRRDSIRSYYEDVLNEIPNPDDNITRILHLFLLKGFNERETVSLLGGHNIGKMSCEFIENRLYNFRGTGKPDPTIAADFLNKIRLKCEGDNNSRVRNGLFESMDSEATNLQELASSLSSGEGFDTHYYQGLLMGQGLLFADQQLMAEEKTARLVRAYASDDGSTFRLDFAEAMVKMSNLGVLTGSQGEFMEVMCVSPFSYWIDYTGNTGLPCIVVVRAARM